MRQVRAMPESRSALPISRRHLLALLGATAAAAGLVGAGTVVRWWDAAPDAPYAQLSDEEAAVVRAWAQAAFPGGESAALEGGEAALDRYFDALLGALPETQAKLMKVLLHAIEAGSLLLGGGRFTRLEEREARAVFHALVDHDVAEVRGAVLGLTTLLGAGYTTHPAVAPQLARLHRCGYSA